MRTLFKQAIANADPARMQWIDALTLQATNAQLLLAMDQGSLSAAELTVFYLSRIQRYDGALRSIIALNRDALSLAEQCDAERARGDSLGALHGLPVLLKDNIATGDGLPNTAGALALAQHRPPRDAWIVQRLRQAGAIILGKTNLSEWANFMSGQAPSGYSALGGQVVNPFGEHLAVSGSSSGSAAAAAARLSALTIGTETTGSIIAPAAANGVAGMRPSLGLVSTDLIIPITASLDSAGPIARSVSDLATALTVIGTLDESAPNVGLVTGLHGTDFAAKLGSVSLDGLRFGLFTRSDSPKPGQDLFQRAIDALKRQGSTVVLLSFSGSPDAQFMTKHQGSLLVGSMSADVANYLQSANAPFVSLADIIAFNKESLTERARYGQNLLERTQSEAMEPAKHQALAGQVHAAAARLISDAATKHRLDAIVSLDNSFTTGYALAGFPAVTVPTGCDRDGQPHGATFVGIARGEDARLLAIAEAFESETRLGEEPHLPNANQGSRS